MFNNIIMKILTFLKTHWISILIGLILITSISGYIDKYVIKKSDANIQMVDAKTQKIMTIDSVKIATLYISIHKHDSLSVFYEKQATIEGKQAKTYIDKSDKQEQVTNIAKKAFKNDTTLNNCKKIVVSQELEIQDKDSTIHHQDFQISDLSSSLNECRESGVNKDSVIFNLKDENKVTNSDFSNYKTQTIKKEKSSKFASGIKNIGLGVLAVLLILKSI